MAGPNCYDEWFNVRKVCKNQYQNTKRCLEFVYLLFIFARIGQNCVAELFISGIPSTLKFSLSVVSNLIFEHIDLKLFSIPLYQYLPPAISVIMVERGVLHIVLLSFGSQPSPISFNIFKSSFTDRLVTLWFIAQYLSLSVLLVVVTIGKPSGAVRINNSADILELRV